MFALLLVAIFFMTPLAGPPRKALPAVRAPEPALLPSAPKGRGAAKTQNCQTAIVSTTPMTSPSAITTFYRSLPALCRDPCLGPVQGSGAVPGQTARAPADGLSSSRTGRTAAAAAPAPRSAGRGGWESSGSRRGARWWPPGACGRDSGHRRTRPPRTCGARGPAMTTCAGLVGAAGRWWTPVLDRPPSQGSELHHRPADHVVA